jgi:hypothetical protein
VPLYRFLIERVHPVGQIGFPQTAFSPVNLILEFNPLLAFLLLQGGLGILHAAEDLAQRPGLILDGIFPDADRHPFTADHHIGGAFQVLSADGHLEGRTLLSAGRICEADMGRIRPEYIDGSRQQESGKS